MEMLPPSQPRNKGLRGVLFEAIRRREAIKQTCKIQEETTYHAAEESKLNYSESICMESTENNAQHFA